MGTRIAFGQGMASSSFDYTAPATTSSLSMEILRVVLTVICPPIGVALRVGFSLQLLLSVLLTLLGYLPGLVHGIWLLAQTSDHRLRIEDKA